MRNFIKGVDDFLDGSLFGYRRGYVLTHPLVFLNGIYNEIHWAWQRVFRGWDDRVVWSIDSYLAEMIPVWVRQLKKDSIGIPTVCFDEDDWNSEAYEYVDGAEEKAQQKWNTALDEIIIGFESYQKMQLHISDPQYTEWDALYQNGWKKFHEHFGNLWD